MATRSRGEHPTTMSKGDVSSTERLLVGVVVRWGRGFGWIQAPERGDWFFAHHADLVDAVQLEPGRQVRFMPSTTARGPRALRIELLPMPTAAARSGR
jgi:cold shock CspA family protein